MQSESGNAGLVSQLAARSDFCGSPRTWDRTPVSSTKRDDNNTSQRTVAAAGPRTGGDFVYFESITVL